MLCLGNVLARMIIVFAKKIHTLSIIAFVISCTSQKKFTIPRLNGVKKVNYCFVVKPACDACLYCRQTSVKKTYVYSKNG